MKLKHYASGLVVALGFSAHGALYYTDSTVGTITDNSIIGLTRSTTISDPAWDVTGVTLTFNLGGGFGTDLKGYLRAGNLETSPFFDLTSTLHSYATFPGAGTPITVDFSTPSFQSTFTHINPNTQWTLFFADQSTGGTTTLNGWSLDISAVPEPTEVALGIFGLVGGLGGLIRWQMKRRAA